MMRHPAIIVGMALTCGMSAPPMRAQDSVTGYWEGTLRYRAVTQRIALTIEAATTGCVATVDIPAMTAVGMRIRNAECEGRNVHIPLPFGRGTLNAVSNGVQLTGTTGNNHGDEEFEVQALLRRAEAPPAPPYSSRDVTFDNGDVRLAGTLTVPNSPGRHPAIVITHGANVGERDFFMYRYVADLCGRNGVAVLRYDRRGSGASTGDFQTANFADLADDALAGLHYLQTLPTIEPRRIGMWGYSQGGWISPTAAGRSADVAFVITVSAAGVTPAQQMDFYGDQNLARGGFGPTAQAAAHRIREQRNEYYRGRIDRLTAQRAVDSVAHAPWFPLAGLEAELPADVTTRQWYRQFQYQPTVAWEHVRVPVLLLFGEADATVPQARSVPLIRAALARGGNTGVTVRGFAGADHTLIMQPPPTLPWRWQMVAPEYGPTLLRWIQQHVIEAPTRQPRETGASDSAH